MEHKEAESRGARMLSLMGIRLKKERSNTNWTIVPNTKSPESKEQVEQRRENEERLEKYEETVGNDKYSEDLEDLVQVKQSRKIKKTVEKEEPSEEVEENDTSNEEDPFYSDDSIQDPDYATDESSSSSEEGVPLITLQEDKTEQDKKKTRKRKADPTEWKRNKTKVLRNSGQSYNTLNKNKLVQGRQIKMPCDDRCKLKCSIMFTDQDRAAIFKKYWDFADISKQRAFIATLMQEISPKYTYHKLNNDGKRRRSNNNAFFFIKDDKKVRVCKIFFISTLGITNRCIRSVITKRKEGTFEDKRGKHGNQKLVAEDIKNDIRTHIASIPKIESHYTRAHSEREYIEGGKTIVDLYRDYKKDCETNEKPVADLSMYRKIFNYEFNLAFFVPKKDQCQKCVAYENSTSEEKEAMEADYLTHQKEKTLSREEKGSDKEKINKNYQVACFDLQATLPTPRGDVSSFYYRSKLATYNFTVCDLTKKGIGSVTCFMWHEGQGKRGPNEIGSCLLKYLKQKSEVSEVEDLEIVFYSDNCAGQQKNKFVLAAYFYAVAKYNNIKSITHKYLVTGHTQNEGDNVHSLIEKNIKRALKSGPIYTPDQYVMLVQTAKKTGEPYAVMEMNHDDFLDIKNLTTQISFNFNRDTTGEIVKFSEGSIFKVERENLDRFYYKTSFSDSDFKTVIINNQRSTRTRNVSFRM